MARDDLLRLARWFDEADSVSAHALFAGAFGMYSARWLGEPCDEDGASVVTSWWRGPRVPAALGASGGPAPTAPVDDHSEQRARLRDDAEAAAHWRRAAAEELRDTLGTPPAVAPTGTPPDDTRPEDAPTGDSTGDVLPAVALPSEPAATAPPHARSALNGQRPLGTDDASNPHEGTEPTDADPAHEHAVDLSGPALDILMELLAAALATGDPAAAPRTSGDLDLDLRLHVHAEPGRTLRLRGAGGEFTLAGLHVRATPFVPTPGTVDDRPDGDPDPAGGR